jgi:hypothetical protein
MVMELVTNALAITGVVCLLYKNAEIGFLCNYFGHAYAFMSFFGQRVAKFYGEAAGIVPSIIMVFLALSTFL